MLPPRLLSAALRLPGGHCRTSWSAVRRLDRRITERHRDVIALRNPPGYAVAMGSLGVRGDCRQPAGVPVLPTSDTPPVAAGLERDLRHGGGRVAHRTDCMSGDVLFVVSQCNCREPVGREATLDNERKRTVHARLLMCAGSIG